MTERASIHSVNIPLGDDVSKMLYNASKLTHGIRPGLVQEASETFSGFRSIPLGQFNDVTNLHINLGFDGIGTKVEVPERLRNHTTIAHDLFAMVCDDAVVRGAEPIAIGTILDIRKLDDTEYTRRSLQQMALGYVAAAYAADVVIVNGETAELGDRVGGYGEFNYNWGAAVLWLAHRDRVLTGAEIRPGDTLIGLADHGMRSNGLTAVRLAMEKSYGDKWHDKILPELGRASLGELVLTPSTIYTKFVTNLTGGYDIAREPTARVSGVAHITGGGQPSKLGRMLEPSGLGVVIDNPLDPPAIMRKAQELLQFSDEDAYGNWHMGPGMVIATPDPDKVLDAADKSHGIVAQQIGTVIESPSIRIKNRGSVGEKRWLTFPTKRP